MTGCVTVPFVTSTRLTFQSDNVLQHTTRVAMVFKFALHFLGQLGHLISLSLIGHIWDFMGRRQFSPTITDNIAQNSAGHLLEALSVFALMGDSLCPGRRWTNAL
ncbi:hypothetical protein TNCV_4564981 [Trichonephila clavipes]|nr:hypothetical protein TNCV_4564981 [Trichonephila clavipes]